MYIVATYRYIVASIITRHQRFTVVLMIYIYRGCDACRMRAVGPTYHEDDRLEDVIVLGMMMRRCLCYYRYIWMDTYDDDDDAHDDDDDDDIFGMRAR